MGFLYYVLAIRHYKEKDPAFNTYIQKLKQATVFKLSKENSHKYKMPERNEVLVTGYYHTQKKTKNKQLKKGEKMHSGYSKLKF
jgi:hypothetical protein